MSGPFTSAWRDLAASGWDVGPCAGKVPLPEHGYKDFTRDTDRLARWAKQYPRANIGARVPDSLIVLDVDPRNGGETSLAELEVSNGPLPPTLTSITGGGGRHLFYRRPPGRLINGSNKLGPGLDVKLGGRGLVIVPPSIHPETRRPYRWDDPTRQPANLPSWLTSALRPALRPPPSPASRLSIDGPRPGDRLNAELSWAEILTPAGWAYVGIRGGTELWRRPGKTDGISATVNALGTDRLHVFTSSAAPFEADESYSKFGAWTLLHADGDFSAAARALRGALA